MLVGLISLLVVASLPFLIYFLFFLICQVGYCRLLPNSVVLDGDKLLLNTPKARLIHQFCVTFSLKCCCSLGRYYPVNLSHRHFNCCKWYSSKYTFVRYRYRYTSNAVGTNPHEKYFTKRTDSIELRSTKV